MSGIRVASQAEVNLTIITVGRIGCTPAAFLLKQISNFGLSAANALCAYCAYECPQLDFDFSRRPSPLYLQVIEQDKRRVAVRDFPSGTELPSIRELATGLKVSVITIKRAYLELEREVVTATRQVKGAVAADQPRVKTYIQESELLDHLKHAVRLGLLLG